MIDDVDDRFDFISDLQDYEEDDMQVQEIRSMFNFPFEKSSADIIAAADKKIGFLKAKIVERQVRIAKVREEYKIDDKALNTVLTQARNQQQQSNLQMSYAISNSVKQADGKMTEETVTIGAGVVNHLLTENDFIEGEKAQVEKLSMVVRNLQDLPDSHGKLRGHRVTIQELEFLGF